MSWSARPEVVEAEAAKRPHVQFRESAVPAYTLPDPLALPGGGRVMTPEQWAGQRTRLKQLFQDEVFGAMPPAPAQVSVDVVERDDAALDGRARFLRLSITCTLESGQHLTFESKLYVPEGPPRPVFVVIDHMGRTDRTGELDRAFWPVKEIIGRGYATATLVVVGVSPDDAERYREGLLDLIEPGGDAARTAHSTGALAVWSWGASRVLDALEHLSEVDAGRSAIVGHSRGGKTSLLTGAMDERFGLVAVNDSGCTGAAIARRRLGETVRHITTGFPRWFALRYASYADREADLPFDQHMLVSLVAPRTVCVGSADEDLWADPRGEWLGLVHAAPVFRLLGQEALGPEDAMPDLDAPVHRGATDYHIRKGGHGLKVADWLAYLDAADRLWG